VPREIVGDEKMVKTFCKVGSVLGEDAKEIDNRGKLTWDKRVMRDGESKQKTRT